MPGPALDLHRPVSISDAVVARELDGETVLLNLDTGIYFGLNDVGTRVWQLLAGGRSPAAAVDVLLAEYETTRETLERDIQQLVERLAASGLVRPGGSAP